MQLRCGSTSTHVEGPLSLRASQRLPLSHLQIAHYLTPVELDCLCPGRWLRTMSISRGNIEAMPEGWSLQSRSHWQETHKVLSQRTLFVVRIQCTINEPLEIDSDDCSKTTEKSSRSLTLAGKGLQPHGGCLQIKR